MENLRPNEQRAKTAIILIWIIFSIKMASVFSNYFQYSLLQTAAHGGHISFESATINDIIVRLIAILNALAYIISGIVFIQWFRRAYYNLHQKVDHLTFSDGWAAGSWFVPIITLFRPYNIMKELYEETDRFLFHKHIEVREKLTTSILGWWWTLWIISGILGQIVFRSSYNAKTLEQLTFATMMNMISVLVAIPLCLVTIKMIKNYSSVEAFLNEPVEDILPIEEDKIIESEIL